jgi:hypothetical protein
MEVRNLKSDWFRKDIHCMRRWFKQKLIQLAMYAWIREEPYRFQDIFGLASHGSLIGNPTFGPVAPSTWAKI